MNIFTEEEAEAAQVAAGCDGDCARGGCACATPTRKPRVLFVDTETTGLDPDRHELIELAVVEADEYLREVAHLTMKVRPTHIEAADPVALAVNGYTPEGWADAVDLGDALSQLALFLDGVTVVGGHNVKFDIGFLAASYHRTGVPPPDAGFDIIDTCAMARARGMRPASLDAVCGALGIDRTERHRALADARASLEVARRMRWTPAELDWS